MSDKFRSRAAVRDKVEWEGGVMDALDYGIHVADMPDGDEELTAAWQALEDAFNVLQPLADAVEKLLEAAGDDDAGDDEAVTP